MRKQMIIILSVLWLMACNSGMEADAMKSNESVETEEAVFGSEMEADEAMPVSSDMEYNYLGIVSEKLQEYIELKQLIDSHPEFENDLRKQLLSLSSDSILNFGNSEIISISDIQLLSSQEQLFDSLDQGIKVRFKVSTDTETRIDSLLAKIQKETVVIEGESYTSTKVTFQRIEN